MICMRVDKARRWKLVEGRQRRKLERYMVLILVLVLVVVVVVVLVVVLGLAKES
jgi:predicted nucleic acid-binding Zn ribbon protein